MSTTVYLVGHGRVAANTPINLPSNITMHWLAPLGDVTGGLSRAFLSGVNTNEYGHDNPLSSIEEHYLCADQDWPTDGKIVDFLNRPNHPHGSTDPYFLYTRPNIDMPLSSIFTFLKELSPTNDWHLYWTCCRGFIGVNNPYKSEWKNGAAVRTARVNPPKSTAVGPTGPDKHRLADAGFDTVVMIAKSDQNVIARERNDKGQRIQNPTTAVRQILEF
jgi:hypothetical protein